MNLVDLSGSALPHRAAILAAWNSRESINLRPEQSTPAVRRMGDCRVSACGHWIPTAGCLPPVHARIFPYGRPRLRPTSPRTCQSRRLSWTRSYNCLAVIWHRFSRIRPFVPQYAARPVKDRFGKPLLHLHPIHPALASTPLRRR